MKTINLFSNVLHDNYTEYVCDKYDLHVEETIITKIPMIDTEDLNKFNWNIGLICGNSGSGKSTVMSQLGTIMTPNYDNEKCVISQFPMLNENQAAELLQSVGLSSVPTWLHKPNQLSNGEKARLDLCWIIANTKNDDAILIDEFTSVVNRDCAKSMSYTLQRYIRQYNKKIIIASCHFDIIEWLKPDWVFNLNKQDVDNQSVIEHLTYLNEDNSNYQLYKSINQNDILTNSFELLNQ